MRPGRTRRRRCAGGYERARARARSWARAAGARGVAYGAARAIISCFVPQRV